MVQTRQCVWYTKTNNSSKREVQEMPEIYGPTPGNDYVNELYVQVVKKHILYIYDTGRFPIRGVVPAPDVTIYLVDNNGTRYLGSI